VSDKLNHPSEDRLEAYIEETLDGAARSVLESHLATCARCRTEVIELRSLFEALSSLPQLSPSVGFADRVMKDVRVRRPVLARLNDWVERLTPHTDRGWAVATAALAMPVLASAALVWWVLSQPGVSAQGLALVATSLASDALATGWQWLWMTFAGSQLALWTGALLEMAESLGRGGLSLAAVMFAAMTAASIYVLYQNLIRPQPRRADHASYIF
jgi:multisubunit Na+/H+ antiporter MnhB subunit